MDNNEKTNPVQQAGELLKENRILKRKLALAEQNLVRAQHVSEAKSRVEATLHKSNKKEQQFFQLVLENTNNILLLLGFDGRFAYASNSFLKATDIESFGLINGAYYRDVLKTHISNENLMNFCEAVDSVAVEKDIVFFEQQIDFASKGKPRIYSISVIPMTGEDGKSTGIMIMLNDITEIRYQGNLLTTVNKVSAILLEPEIDKFEDNLFDAMSLLAEVTDVDNVYIWKNHTVDGKLFCNKIYEWPEGASPHQGNERTVNVSYAESMSGLEELLKNGHSLNAIVSEMPKEHQDYLAPQGVMSILNVPIILHDKFWGYIGFDDCHSERKFSRNEEVILRSAGRVIANALLRQEMFQNIRETSVKLESALEQATAASKAKGNFLSNMSHEMRTPLNAIIGMTAIGKKNDKTEEKDYALSKIGDASSHLLGVINDILDMSKIEADKMEFTPLEFSFDGMLQKVIAVISFRIEEKQQRLTVKVDSSIPPFIVGDDQRLAQVITNLMSNAVKFTPEYGNIQLEASLAQECDEGCELRIEIADNGIGISREQQENLFKAFMQAESGTSREYGGTGLGLAISKRIVELMGGRIWVESEIGKGARFIFTVMVQRGERRSQAESTDSMNERSGEGGIEECDKVDNSLLNGKRLLLVEDIEVNREILIALLDNTGIIIDCAENGKEALDMVEAAPGKYDIVFMDVQMPKMDGFEATRRIRALPAMKNIKLPIVAMTANVFKSDIEECLASGMDDHLGKPLYIDQVINVLKRYLCQCTIISH